MTRPLLLLRPEPGNAASAARVRERGLETICVPLFEIVALPERALPSGPFDALLLTSANGARFGAAVLAHFAALPLFATGAATAEAARAQGHGEVIIGGGDAESTAAAIAAAGHRRVLHVSGVEARPFDPHGLEIVRHDVYRAAETPEDEVKAGLSAVGDAVAAVHSPRAGQRLAGLIAPARRRAIRIAAISAAAAQACGEGWAETQVAARKDDTALLALAETLCKSDG